LPVYVRFYAACMAVPFPFCCNAVLLEAGIFLCPFLSKDERNKTMKNKKPVFFIILALTILLAYCAFVGLTIPFGIYVFHFPGATDMRFGIDIRGGVDAVYQPAGLDRSPTPGELESARSIIETRLDKSNILDREITVDNTSGSVIVRFPWKANETNIDPQRALAELGETAMLTFRDGQGNVILEGKHVIKSMPMTDQQTGGYSVSLDFDQEGTKIFADATQKLISQPIHIYMDDTLIQTAKVREFIPNGNASIDQIGSMEEAKKLSDKINSGTLPFSMVTRNNSIISPILGGDALAVMVEAGVIAFCIICCLLIFYYRMSGVVASIALLMQVAGQILILSTGQITLTLTGIAGIILSIGMGVDANVIISERISDEIKSGKATRVAVSAGFKNAFSSVFDGNITVLIVSFVLIALGSGSLLSFAYTLVIGIAFNFIAGVTASRLMIRSLISFNAFNKPALFTCFSRRVTL
ncbi:MAG: protein translocase subunit SecD, partial [Eubacteriales bacterium]